MQRITVHMICLLALLGISFPAIAQSDTLCVNATTNNYFVINTAGSSYFWDTQGNGAINSGQGAANANITWTQTPGTYLLSVTETNQDGCDGLPQELTIVVLPVYNDTTDVALCENNLPYTWNGNSYAAAGIYSISFSSSDGCDSIVTLDLTILPALASTTDLTICDAQLPYNWNGLTFTAAGSQSATLTSAAGCDSIATLNLIVNPALTSSTDSTVCAAQLPFNWNGLTFLTAGSQSATLTSAAGCDSIATLNLIVNPAVTSSIDSTVCATQLPFNWNGLTFNTAGSQSATLTSAAGCDSIATLNLIVNPALTSSTDSIVCSAQLPFTWNGLTFSAAGSQSATLISAAGCDSIATLNLIVNPALTSSTDSTVCAAQLPIIWNGLTFNAAGSQSATLTSAAGCDSIATLNLIVNPALTSSTDSTVCAAQLPFTWNGLTFSAAGTQSATLTSAAGCDSIATLNLIVNPALTSSTDSIVCAPQLPFTWNGLTFNTAGSQSATLTSAAGCDSIATLNLIVNPALNSSTDSTVCAAQLPFTWNGLTFLAAGSQSATLTSAAGCDSLVTLILIVNDTFIDTLAISICEGSTHVLPDGISVTASGTYTSNFQNQFGCDSIITTVLAVDPQITLTLSNDTGICAGTSIDLIVSGAAQYSWDPAEGLSSTTGSTVSATPLITTTYNVTGQSGTCTASDSIVVEVLPLPELSVTPASATLCSGDSIQLTASGAESYSWSEASLFDCDTCATALLSPINSTTVVLEGTLGLCNASIQIPVQVLEWPLAQITADTSICEGDTITLLGSGGINYLWSNGDTSAQSIVSPQSNSIYTLIADNGVCADTSTVEIVVHPLPIAFAGEDTTIRYGTSVQLNATASDNFTWNPLDQLDCTFCLDPVASPPATIEYCLNVTNSFGCVAYDCVTITVDTLCADLFIPNVFAPDAAGDEANNCFRIYGGDCITNMNLKIFTRWGELIFETQRTGDCWDGTHKGKELNPGVYIYQFDAGIIKGERISKQGNVTLIK